MSNKIRIDITVTSQDLLTVTRTQLVNGYHESQLSATEHVLPGIWEECRSMKEIKAKVLELGLAEDFDLLANFEYDEIDGVSYFSIGGTANAQVRYNQQSKAKQTVY